MSAHGRSAVTGERPLDRQVAGQQVRDALAVVRDPTLRRALTEVGFVSGVTIDGGQVHVRLRLPSYATPESVAVVAADTRAAVAALAWVHSVEVCVADHATAGARDVAVHAHGPVPPRDATAGGHGR
jgi:metal-sulfur cluster biosynthetic enzyme